jgi:hypothetical protein
MTYNQEGKTIPKKCQESAQKSIYEYLSSALQMQDATFY